MKRIIYMILKSLLVAPYYLVALCYHSSKRHLNYDKAYVICRKIVARALKTGNIELEIMGKDKLPLEDGYLITPNHQGMFDMLVMMNVFKKCIAFIPKIEIANVFVLKQVIAGTGSICIDRNDIKQSMKVIIKVSDEIKAGKNFVIFPEGTRSRDGNNILDFKGGSFKSAMRVKAPIVPCAIIDSYKVLDTNSIKPVKVTAIFLDPIYPKEYEGMTTTDVAIVVKEKIENKISEYLKTVDN